MAYKCTTRSRASTAFIVVHCSATQAKADIGAADIDRWHRGQGWQCIGYHYVIRRTGLIEEGREEDKIGSHRRSNASSSAVRPKERAEEGSTKTAGRQVVAAIETWGSVSQGFVESADVSSRRWIEQGRPNRAMSDRAVSRVDV
jgi:hypothetical protein